MDIEWECPLLSRVIEEGLCTDINFQRFGIVKVGTELTSALETVASRAELEAICDACPHQGKVVTLATPAAYG